MASKKNAVARLRLLGGDALSDEEIVTTVIGSCDIANELMATYGDLPSLGRAKLVELERQLGAGRASCLIAAMEMGRRAVAPRHRRQVMRTSGDVFGYFAPRLTHLDHEVFHALCLDTKHRVLRDVRIVEGGITTCSVLPREAFAPALREGASAVIFIHNHPSGDPTPSSDDLALTIRLKQAGAVLGIKPLDHIIIGEGRYVSLADDGQFDAL
jgi:DNA repair protein RadC